ncbi:Protein F55H12.4 [Aphelenchoides avenae]|nr:Protein F55H12.4 [Aphelenchus avenae]
MVRQCTCAEVEPCKGALLSTLLPCADSCQKHASALGANYGTLRSCLQQREPAVRATMQCTEQMHSNACSRGPGGQVPKRYPETLQIAAMSEINRMLNRAGVANQVKSLLAQGKKFYGCIRSCMDKRAGNCAKKLGCGLALPADNVLVQNAKQCAMRSGFGTGQVQQLCQCAVSAGIRQLAPVCPKLVVS